MGSMEQFLQTTGNYQPKAPVLDNLSALQLPAGKPRLRVLWMYPDILSLHGGRGDLMALMRFATAVGLPLEIRRVEQLTDPVPLDAADMLYFCCGDLCSMPGIIQALSPRRGELQTFADAGKVIAANGSSGAILAKALRLLDGTSIEGLGLLNMDFIERDRVHRAALAPTAMDGVEVIGNEIKLADVTLGEGQQPFGAVRYGRGNCGDGYEGAVTGNVIYTSCLGPVLVRNPALAFSLLRRGAEAAGLSIDPQRFAPDPEDVAMELQGLADAKVFIQNKMAKK